MFIAEEKLHFSLSVIFIVLGEKSLSPESFLAIWLLITEAECIQMKAPVLESCFKKVADQGVVISC